MPPPETPQLEMGGQAVIEGVLMRTRHGYSVAVRRLSGQILVRSVPFRSLARKYPLLKAPFIRGASALFEMLAIGYQALRFSAEVAEADARAAENKTPANSASATTRTDDASAGLAASASFANAPAAPSANPPAAPSPEHNPLPQDAISAWSSWAMTGVFVVSMAVAVAMMVVLPNLLAAALGKGLVWAGLSAKPLVEEHSPLYYNLVSGLFRAAILLGYIWAIARLEDIRRVFQYHGAEHKAVFAFETSGPLTVERAQTFGTLHPRCGTSFLVVVLVVSIVVFAFVAWLYAALWPGFPALPFFIKKLLIFLGHIVMLPVVAGVSYEYLKWTARRCDKGGLWRWIVWPGLQVQRITTQPPADAQVEVALVALQSALRIAPEELEERTFVIDRPAELSCPNTT